jgi:UV DNA damage endonuclease
VGERSHSTPAARARLSEHRLGFAVKVLGKGGLPSHDTRRHGSGPHLRHSLANLRAILDRLRELDVSMYRFASGLAPYASHPGLPRFHGQVAACAAELESLGGLVRERGVRLSSHPGQYTVLNSEDPRVRASAAAELEVQASLLDAMGLGRDAVVVVHVGGAAGGVGAALDRFERGLATLSDAARARLVVENDDRAFGIRDVLELSRRTGLRVVWDALHHRCHDPERIPDDEALAHALATWGPGDGTPKIHFSSPRLDITEKAVRSGRRTIRTPVLPQLRAHADLIDPVAFEQFIRAASGAREFDVMLEAKGKDLALVRLREQLAERGLGWSDGRLCVPARRAAAAQLRLS